MTGIGWSFFKMRGYTPEEWVGFDNYIQVFRTPGFGRVMLNTLQYVFWSFLIGFLPPLFIAFFINEMVHFKNGFRILIYLPAIMPGITVLLLWYFIYYPDQTGLGNQLLARFGIEPYIWLNDSRFTIIFLVLEMTWHGFAGTMFLYYTAIQSIQTELYEAAMIDGAGSVRRFWNVAIPQLSGIILLNIVRQIIAVFQVLQEPMVMTGGGPNGASMSVSYQMYLFGLVQGRVGESLALGTIVFFLLIIGTCFYFYLNKKVEDNY